jgi:hypothetical protein
MSAKALERRTKQVMALVSSQYVYPPPDHYFHLADQFRKQILEIALAPRLWTRLSTLLPSRDRPLNPLPRRLPRRLTRSTVSLEWPPPTATAQKPTSISARTSLRNGLPSCSKAFRGTHLHLLLSSILHARPRLPRPTTTQCSLLLETFLHVRSCLPRPTTTLCSLMLEASLHVRPSLA